MDSQVLIVGGGPSGMWLACELRLAGVSVVLLERDLEIVAEERGMTVHPRTLEVLDMRGIVDQFLAAGIKLPGASFGQLETLISYSELETDFPYVLGHVQARTTAVLEQRAIELGADVRRGCRVIGLDDTGDSVKLTVEGPNGTSELEGLYAVGCDGTRSFVRETLGIPYIGTDASVRMWVGDATADDPPSEPVLRHWDVDGTVLVIDLPSGGRRFMGIAKEDVSPEVPPDLTFEDLRSKVTKMTGRDFGMHTPTWLSRTGNGSRLAESYRKGRVFLVGDAAHRHFPLGGMGMNTSIQDSMNLGWKLAAVIHGSASEPLLDTYHDERHVVGEDLLEYTQAQTAVTTLFSPDGAQFRKLFDKLLTGIPDLLQDLARRTSGLSVRYAAEAPAHSLAGARAPNLHLAGATDRLYRLLHDGSLVLLDLTDSNIGGVLSSEGLPETMKVVSTKLAPGKHQDDWVGVTAALIRPDGYVAWASSNPDGRALADGVLRSLEPWGRSAQASAK